MTTENPAKEYKYRKIYIGRQKILRLFTKPIEDYANFFYLQGVPDNAKVIECYYEGAHAAFCFIIEHESFKPIKIGEQIPLHSELFTVTMERLSDYKRVNDATNI